jgi:hypothetical protein
MEEMMTDLSETPGSGVLDPQVIAGSLNRSCFCISLDRAELVKVFQATPETRTVLSAMGDEHANMFAAFPVFVSRQRLDRMAEIVRAAEAVISSPTYRDLVLEDAPAVVRFEPRARGVFMSFDFHLASDEPKLIEINTNAGGALLNLLLARAQRACCQAVQPMMPSAAALDALEKRLIDMFLAEWRLERGGLPLRRIAIVDEHPEAQYLYLEFLLFQQLFVRNGIDAVIADPSALSMRDGMLLHGDGPVDLIYNRLTDFMLERPAHHALREAYLNGSVVLTPHPRAHALYANKKNLAVLSDPARLRALGIPDDISRVLVVGVPRTEAVEAAKADSLWSRRRKLFFKPASGFGSKAAYRGEKLTRRVWQEILAGDYVAQELVAPGERMIGEPGTLTALKFDVRNYVYDGEVQFVTARLYQGQTTNARTPGGGFAPVFTASGEEAADARHGRNCPR